jgi:uncharacterized membrane protein (DUF485 family)
MSEEQAAPATRTRKFGRHVLAAAILLVCAYVLFHLLIGVVITILTVIAVAAAIIGIIWAVHVIF